MNSTSEDASNKTFCTRVPENNVRKLGKRLMFCSLQTVGVRRVKEWSFLHTRRIITKKSRKVHAGKILYLA